MERAYIESLVRASCCTLNRFLASSSFEHLTTDEGKEHVIFALVLSPEQQFEFSA
jgi:hypothetical protein